MLRKIIHIDQDKCNGCSSCAAACHEGAIAMVEGKAQLMRDDYCDGLGDCLPACPTGAITFVEREAKAYDEVAVLAHKARQAKGIPEDEPIPACPGTRTRQLEPASATPTPTDVVRTPSRLAQWPCQIKLAPVKAPYFDGCKLLIAADCTAYAYAAFHEEYMKGRVTLVGCPKLDGVDYSEKLTEILKVNAIKSVALVRMEVPCCGGMENALKKALAACGKLLPWQVVTLSVDGCPLEE